MRSNRNTRLGLAAIAVALILLGLVAIISRLRGPSTTQTVEVPAENNAATQPVSTNNQSMGVFARVDIPERSILTPDMLEMKPLDVGGTDFVRDLENGAVGFITKGVIRKGTAVRNSALVGHISDVGIAGALLPGRRAIVVPIANKATLHDLVRIGDRVDIIATFDQQETRTVVQDVRVLAVDVFGKDYPQVKVAMRGDYKANPHSIGTANPGSPPSTGQPGQPTNENAPPAPTPTPQPSPPPTKPEAALTLEVTPQQATDLSMAKNAGNDLDFLLRSHDEAVLAGTTTTGAPGAVGVSTNVAPPVAAYTTRARIAPYAERKKNGAKAEPAKAVDRMTTNMTKMLDSAIKYDQHRMNGGYPTPEMPSVGTSPAQIRETIPTPAQTYDIPIYGDGKLVRTDTVRKPQD